MNSAAVVCRGFCRCVKSTRALVCGQLPLRRVWGSQAENGRRQPCQSVIAGHGLELGLEDSEQWY